MRRLRFYGRIILCSLVFTGAPMASASYISAANTESALPAATPDRQFEPPGTDVVYPSFADAVPVEDSIAVAPPVRSEPRARSTKYEHILSFDSRAAFAPDGEMQVTEQIKIYSAGQQIRRGIFRTLPLSWDRQDGKSFRVNYRIDQVLRDGVSEPYSEQREGKTLTIRIGSAERILAPGEYTYVIRYRISNHFSRFADWDELYWNVTGNGWGYAIDRASFHLTLPDAAAHLDANGRDTRLRTIDTYTGVAGAKGTIAQILADGSVVTTDVLRAGEGLTVAYTWPRSILAGAVAPETVNPLVHLFLPTRDSALLWGPAGLLALYFLRWWRRYVTKPNLRMPSVVALYDAPPGFSPGRMRYVVQRGYDDVCFSSDILDLVAKKGAALVQNNRQGRGLRSNGAQRLVALPAGQAKALSADDRDLLETIFSGRRKEIDLSKAYQEPMQDARELLASRYSARAKKLFLGRGGAITLGILIMLLTPLLCGILFNPLVGILTLPALLATLVTVNVLLLPLRLFSKPRQTLGRMGCIRIFLFLLFGLPLISALPAMLTALDPFMLPAGYAGALLVCLLMCFVFSSRAPRYTQEGYNELAKAQGLKRYLSTAESHRLETLYPPDKLLTHFERMLPYALALDVGKTWANAFSHYLIASGSMSEVFANADWDSVHRFSDSCRSSSAAEPSSSSDGGSGSGSSGSGSSGGGSSGGGSGGGGGGGW